MPAAGAGKTDVVHSDVCMCAVESTRLTRWMCLRPGAKPLCATCYDHFGKRKKQERGPNVVHTRVCSSLTAHGDRASELRSGLIERGCPLSLERNPCGNDVTLRHGQQNTKLPRRDVSNRHSKTVLFLHSHKSANTRPGMAHCSGARTSRRPSLKSLMHPPSFFSQEISSSRVPLVLFPPNQRKPIVGVRGTASPIETQQTCFDRLQ